MIELRGCNKLISKEPKWFETKTSNKKIKNLLLGRVKNEKENIYFDFVELCLADGSL